MKKPLILLFPLILFNIAIHLIPFLFYGPHPLGYDTGFYRRYVAQPFVSFPNTAVPGLGEDALVPRILLDVLRLAHIPTDSIIYGSYILLFAAQAVALFFLAQYYWNTRAGLFTVLLFSISPIQYTAYWFMLYKNAFALPLMLAAFLLLEKRSRLAIPLGILIASSHHTTGIIFLLTAGVYALLNRENRNVILQTFTGTFITFLSLHYSSIPDYIHSPIAVFMDKKEYLVWSSPLLILAWFGIQKFACTHSRSVIIAFFIVTAAFPLFSLPFYERIFIFTDIAVIMAAAMGCHTLYQKIIPSLSRDYFRLYSLFTNLTSGRQDIVAKIKNKQEKTTQYGLILASGMLIGLIALSTYGRIGNLRQLVSPEDLHELNAIARNVSSDATILTSTALAPWVQGWSLNKIVAPGLLHDTRTAQEWALFWTGDADAKKKFLNTFPKPLFIFADFDQKRILVNGIEECLSEKTQFLLLYIC